MVNKRRLKRLAAQIPGFTEAYRWIRPSSGDTLRYAVEKPLVYRMLGTDLGETIDVGFGGGLYTPYLVAHASAVISLDRHILDSVVVERWRLLRPGKITILKGDAQALPFTSHCFDTVLCTQVLEHLDDVRAGCRELSRVLRTSGKAIISVPVPPSPFPPAPDDDTHKVEGFTIADLRAILEEAGLMVIQWSYCFNAIARGLFRCLAWSTRTLKIAPPGVFVILPCYLDRLLGSHGKFSPYALIVEVRKMGD